MRVCTFCEDVTQVILDVVKHYRKQLRPPIEGFLYTLHKDRARGASSIVAGCFGARALLVRSNSDRYACIYKSSLHLSGKKIVVGKHAGKKQYISTWY